MGKKKYVVSLEETAGNLYICRSYFDEVKKILGKDPEWVRAAMGIEAYMGWKTKNLYRIFKKRKRDEYWEWTFGVSDFEHPRRVSDLSILSFITYHLRYYDIGLGEKKVFTQENYETDKKPAEAFSWKELLERYNVIWV